MLGLRGGDDRGAIGTWVKLPTPESVEILAYAGVDFVVVDLEHTALDLTVASTQIAFARAVGLDPLVRVPDHGHSAIQRVLDAGAAGVIVPHVDTADQAEQVVRAVRFPPRGDRGSGGTSRAGRWGLLPRAEYLAHGNEEARCIVQLESKQAIDNAAAIMAVDGVDAVLVGTADLSMSMGLTAASDEVQQLVDAALAAADAARCPIGTAAPGAAQATAALARGFDYVVASNDTSLLAGAARALVDAVRAPAAAEVAS